MDELELTRPYMLAVADFQKALGKAEELRKAAPLSAHDAEEFLKAVGHWRSETAQMLAGCFENQSAKGDFLKRFSPSMPAELSKRVELGHRMLLFGIGFLNALGTKYIDPNFKSFSLAVPESDEVSSDVASRDRVFVVHGHGLFKDEVARVLERLNLKAVILQEQPNAGRTLIEKLERYSDVSFAVVIASPDDVGSKDGAELQARARQNVIFELGYFVGKLGRGHVCLINFPGLELPSDFAGVVYVAYDQHGAWQLQLARELREAGFKIDLNKL